MRKPPDAHRYRRDLKTLTEAVTAFLSQLDELMKQPSTGERGNKIAWLCNSMEMINDQIRYGTLGIDFRTDNKPAKKQGLSPHEHRKEDGE